MNRRGFLSLLGGVAAAAALPLKGLFAGERHFSGVGPRVLPGRIDVLSLKHWNRAVVLPLNYELDGQTVFPVYDRNGTPIEQVAYVYSASDARPERLSE